MDSLREDLRYAFRSLLKNRSFAVIALAVLALGIGATVSVSRPEHESVDSHGSGSGERAATGGEPRAADFSRTGTCAERRHARAGAAAG
jgi:hypothetical protein